MERGQNEVTDKIRNAIKKKLTQLSSFVDDELPEYIMILIANKRSKAHIEKDLSLFLGSETAEFSQWLCDLLNSLKASPTEFTGSTTKMNKDNRFGLNENSSENNLAVDVEDGDILALDPQELESDFLSQDLNSEEISLTSSNVQPLIPDDKKNTNKAELIPVIKSEFAKEQRFTTQEHFVNKMTTKAVKVYPIQQVVRMPLCSTVIPVKRTQSQPEFSEDEYDPLNPSVGNIASVVHVTERKYSVPAALQANKLLLRAMDDATKSVLGGKDINEYYKPTPIKVLTSDRCTNILHKPMLGANDIALEPDLRTYINKNNSTNFNADVQSSDEIECVEFELPPSHRNPHDEVFYQSPLSTRMRRTIHRSCSSSDIAAQYVPANMEMVHHANPCKEHDETNNVVNKISNSPHFIVTLEGVDLKSLKRKRTVSNQSSVPIEEDEEEVDGGIHDDDDDDDGGGDVDDEEEIPFCDDTLDIESLAKKQKLNEKCRYWPACKSGDHCSYQHPTSQCKSFPNCKFGGKCLYIHPNCKFDALCSRKDCPYTHASKRKLPLGVPRPVARIPKRNVTKTVCKYFPNCTSKKCPFVHPKLCWYGRECQSSKCTYSHLNVPSRNQMKWHA